MEVVDAGVDDRHVHTEAGILVPERIDAHAARAVLQGVLLVVEPVGGHQVGIVIGGLGAEQDGRNIAVTHRRRRGAGGGRGLRAPLFRGRLGPGVSAAHRHYLHFA